MDKKNQTLNSQIPTPQVKTVNDLTIKIKHNKRMQQAKGSLKDNNNWKCYDEFLEVFICEVKLDCSRDSEVYGRGR